MRGTGRRSDGLRLWKQVGTNPSSRVYYLNDGSQPVVELDSTGTVLKAANTFGANGLLSRNVGGTSSGSTFYAFDPQGSVCQRFGSTANLLSSDEYDAFGSLLSQTPSGVGDVYGFGAQYGYYTDPEDGLVLLTNRYYDPGTGRFLNRDPLGQGGGANQYGFAGNNPSSYADPLGLLSFRQDAGLGGAALGAFGGPIGAGLGYLGGPALYDAVETLGTAIGCHKGGYASNQDVAGASISFALAATVIIPAGGAAAEAEREGLPALSRVNHWLYEALDNGRDVRVATRADAERVALRYSLRGFRNTTGLSIEKAEADVAFGDYKGGYHWADEVGPAKDRATGEPTGGDAVEGHWADDVHGLVRHLQIEPIKGTKVRVFYGPRVR